MDKINFTNLPDQTTPVNATNLNQLQTNVENAIAGAIEITTSTTGTAMKFPDGTLIQYGVIDKAGFLQNTSAIITSQGINWYRSAAPSISFPIQFYNSNYSLNLTVYSTYAGSRVYMARLNSKGTATFQPQLTSVEDFIENGGGYTNLTNVSWQAIGRWK